MSTIGPLPTDSQPLTDKRSNPVWYRYFASLDRAMRAAITALGATVTTTRQIIAGAGLTGGGDLSADRTLDVGAGTGISVTADAVALDTTNSRNVDHSAVSISVGTGLTGGGTIAASRTIALANTAVTAAAYGGSGKRTAFTVDAQGRLTTASDAAITAAEITAGAALTASNDTNVTLTLGGTPATALLKATSITVAWSGTLAASRLNANVVQAIANDTNVTGSVATQTLTLGWTGTLAVSRGGTGAGTASGTALDNITGFASTGILVRTAAGTYAFRTLTGPAAGITVTNGNGVSGNQTLALANDLAALEALSTTGYAKRTGTDAWSLSATIPSSDVGLGSVTNDAQTKAAIVPNTAPSAGQVLAGNAGGTAYAPVSVSGDGTLSSAGALAITKTGGTAFGPYATAVLGQLPGTTTSGGASAGKIGETITSTVLLASAVILANSAATDITSITLTPGDWDVWGTISITSFGSPTITALVGWVSATSATVPTAPNGGAYFTTRGASIGPTCHYPTGAKQILINANTTVYLSAEPVYTGGTSVQGYGFLIARRRS